MLPFVQVLEVYLLNIHNSEKIYPPASIYEWVQNQYLASNQVEKIKSPQSWVWIGVFLFFKSF